MRSLRKLQKQRVQLEEQSKQIQSHTATCITDSHDEDDGNDEDDDDNTLTAANITTNVFNLLEIEDDLSEESDTSSNHLATSRTIIHSETLTSRTTTLKTIPATTHATISTPNLPTSLIKKGKRGKAIDDKEFDIESYAKLLDKKLGIQNDQTDTVQSINNSTLLTINTRLLDYQHEIKRMFGSKVVNAEREKKSIKHFKRSLFSTPKDDWPTRFDTGLSMDHIESTLNLHRASTNIQSSSSLLEFKFVHSKEYYMGQCAFLDAIDTHDPNSIINLLGKYPYLLDALLTLSEIQKQNDDLIAAHDTILKALYILESQFLPKFNLSNAQLSYTHIENRCFFILGFKHLLYLTRKGCWTAVFEMAKVLYGVGRVDDPLAMLLSLDFFALKAGNLDWVLSMWQEFKVEKGLALLPNWVYSCALAVYLRELKDGKGHEDSLNRLEIAIAQYPMVAVKMIEKCGLQDIDTLSLTSKSCQSLNCLEELYVERSFSLFKDPQVALWFKRGVTSTQVLLKTSQSFKKLSNKAFVTRTTKYPKEIPFNILRHLFLSEYAGMNGFIPGHLGSQLLHDPFPPVLNEPHVYDLYQTQRHTALQTSTPFSDMTLFEAFTQSFLPWLNIDPMNPPPLMNEARFRVAFENAFQEVPGLVDGVRDQVMGTFRQLLDEMGVYRQRNGVIEDAALDAPVDTEDEESYAGLDGDNGEIEERE